MRRLEACPGYRAVRDYVSKAHSRSVRLFAMTSPTTMETTTKLLWTPFVSASMILPSLKLTTVRYAATPGTMISTAGTERVMFGDAILGAAHAARTPMTTQDNVVAAWTTTPRSTISSRATFPTMPMPAAVSATLSGVLNMRAKPRTPPALASARRAISTAGARSIAGGLPMVSPAATDTAQTLSAEASRIISAYTVRDTPAEKSSLARSSAPVTSAKPGTRKSTAETNPAWWTDVEPVTASTTAMTPR